MLTSSVNNIIEESVACFAPISLAEMGSVKLMNRIDTKYVVPKILLPAILHAAIDDYFVQEIDSKRVASYDTMYYDTATLDMYLRHHNRQLVRQKIRVRNYVDTQQTFLEVKRKNNKGRTKKKRVEVPGFDIQSDTFGISKKGTWTVEQFIAQKSNYRWAELIPHLRTKFRRITLVNKAMTERLTIDFDLGWENVITNKNSSYDRLAIIELKQDGHLHSLMTNIMLNLRIHPMKISKYCIGTVLTSPGLKHNRFKTKLCRINKLLERDK